MEKMESVETANTVPEKIELRCGLTEIGNVRGWTQSPYLVLLWKEYSRTHLTIDEKLHPYCVTRVDQRSTALRWACDMMRTLSLRGNVFDPNVASKHPRNMQCWEMDALLPLNLKELQAVYKVFRMLQIPTLAKAVVYFYVHVADMTPIALLRATLAPAQQRLDVERWNASAAMISDVLRDLRGVGRVGHGHADEVPVD